MRNKTPEEFVADLVKMETDNRGKKGIVEFREVVKKCEREYFRYNTIFNCRSYNNPNAKWLHRKGIQESATMLYNEKWWGDAFETIKTPYKYERGFYNEIRFLKQSSIPYKLFKKWTFAYQDAIRCVDAIESQGFDEHGGWQSDTSFDKKGRGEAINTDIYGIDNENKLYVVQVRYYSKQSLNKFPKILKNYFLIGYNENGNPFAHSIPSAVVHGAIRKDNSIESPIKAAQAWIWGIKQEKLNSVLRNGDVGLLPVKAVPRKNVVISEGMEKIVDSHFIYSKEIRKNGSMYALNPTVRHMKRQHPTIKGKGWFKVIVGNRANYHEFAAPTAD
jgi:hypothetical protein